MADVVVPVGLGAIIYAGNNPSLLNTSPLTRGTISLPANPRLPVMTGEPQRDIQSLTTALTLMFREVNDRVNALSEGQARAHYNELDTPPTAGSFRKGDFVLNRRPQELGSTNVKYTLAGWRCVIDGSASATTFLEVRDLTGN